MEEELSRLIEAGEAGACVEFLAPLDEKTRRELREVAAAHYERTSQKYYKAHSDPDKKNRFQCASLAVIGTATWSKAKHLQLWPYHLAHRRKPSDVPPEIHVLLDRRPPWLQKWAAWVCEEEWMSGLWPVMRDFERQGLIERPEGEDYYRAFVRAHDWIDENLAARLAADPEILEHHVFRIFETDVLPSNAWCEALIELVDNGSIGRARLLDACLAGLQRDFDGQQATWMRRLHNQLAPSKEEIEARRESYCSLLSSRNSSTVALALRVIGKWKVSSPELARGIFQQLEPVLLARAKTTAKRGLRLLRKTARQQPRLAEEIGLASTAALLHESAEVQHQVLDLLEELNLMDDGALAARLTELADTLATSVTARLTAMGPQRAEEERGGGPDLHELRRRSSALSAEIRERAGVGSALAALESGALPGPLDLASGLVPRLDRQRRTAPIEDVDELLDHCAALLEGERTALAIDRALDGISRLCERRPSDFDSRAEPLRKLVRSKIGENLADLPIIYDFTIDFSLLILAWIEGIGSHWSRLRVRFGRGLGRWLDRLLPSSWELPLPSNDGAWVFSRYVEEIGRRVVRGRAMPLLALPTHQGGWIDPPVLVERLLAAQSNGIATGRLDQVLSLLRLAPEHRQQALEAAQGVKGELGRALRYALGGAERVGHAEALWIAAARSRSPHEDDLEVGRRFRRKAPATAWAPRARLSLDKVKGFWREHLTVAVEHEHPYRRSPKAHLVSCIYALTPQARDVPWACHQWPHHRDPLYVGAAQSLLSREQGPFEGCREAIELLLDPDEPVTDAAAWLLGLALSWTQPEVKGLAVDILVAAIEDGRYDPPRLGGVLAGFVAVPELVPQRWVQPLTQVADTSPLHAERVRSTLEHALADRAHASQLRRLSAALELFHELTVGLGEPVRDAECREFLEAISGKGKNAQRAAAILAVTGPASSRRDMAALAMAGRLERAERWEARLGLETHQHATT